MSSSSSTKRRVNDCGKAGRVCQPNDEDDGIFRPKNGLTSSSSLSGMRVQPVQVCTIAGTSAGTITTFPARSALQAAFSKPSLSPPWPFSSFILLFPITYSRSPAVAFSLVGSETICRLPRRAPPWLRDDARDESCFSFPRTSEASFFALFFKVTPHCRSSLFRSSRKLQVPRHVSRLCSRFKRP